MAITAEQLTVVDDRVTRMLAAHGFPLLQQESLRAYILMGRPCGHFLTAILSNNLTHACMRADPDNQPLLFAYGQFLVNEAARRNTSNSGRPITG